MSDFIKKPCKHCPFRNDVKPFLHPDRAADIAFSSQNPYNDFPCHKTTECNENSGNMEYIDSTKTCAGFLTLRAQNDESSVPKDFVPAWHICYSDPYEMWQAYEEEWHRTHKKIN